MNSVNPSNLSPTQDSYISNSQKEPNSGKPFKKTGPKANRRKEKSLSSISPSTRVTKENGTAGFRQKIQGRALLAVGDSVNVKITAKGSKNIGISEFSNGLTILVPNSTLGDRVQVEIQKIFFASSSSRVSTAISVLKQKKSVNSLSGSSKKYAIGKIVRTTEKVRSSLSPSSSSQTTVVTQSMTNEIPVTVGQVLTVTISKLGPKNAGLSQLSPNFTIIVPPLYSSNKPMKVGDKVSVKVTKLKKDYAFAKVFIPQSENSVLSSLSPLSPSVTGEQFSDLNVVSGSSSSPSTMVNVKKDGFLLGQKLNLILPKTAKSFSKYVVIVLNGQLVFVKKALGVKLGDHVRIQITKKGSNFAVAQFLKRNPLSKTEKFFLAKMTAKQMIESGMHYGEKAIRCHANMRGYIWLRKKGKHQNRPLLKRGRHIINVLKTRRCFQKALKILAKYAAKGKTFLFVGTKKPAAALIARTALLSKTSFFVNTRWLGGMLTNWKTILKSIAQIRPILKEKQRMIQKILEKRQKIKGRLLLKVNLLRKKSKKLLLKGKDFIVQIEQNKKKASFIQESQTLIRQKSMLLTKNQCFIQKYSELMLKQQKIRKQILLLERKGNGWIAQKQILKAQILLNQKKLQEFRQLFLIGQELMKVQKTTQQNGKTVWALSYGKLTKMTSSLDEHWMIPNPSTAVLNKMIQTMQLSFSDLSSLDFTVQPLGVTGVNVNGSPSSLSKETKEMNGSNRAKSETTSASTNEKNTILLSKLLNKFTFFLPFIYKYMQILIERLQKKRAMYMTLSKNIEEIRFFLAEKRNKEKQMSALFTFMEEKFKKQQSVLTILKTKLKGLASEQRLLKFLPKLRYLPTSKAKMYETVELLMKKFVDPKLSYPMEQIYDQKLKFTSKKMAATRKQKWQRLEKYFGGVTKMAKMKKSQISNNVAIIVGQREEMNAVRECKKLGIKMFTIVDTNCNPKLADHIIPANDDSRNSVKYILEKMLIYIRLAQKLRVKVLSRRMKSSSLRN
uniref:Small ribosomal subunit protein uS2c n=1 Tax=Rotundella rotunda TaxID=1357779 RepID=A0A140GIH6_9CHLO|nr:ribosomal protein S2 [Rotundella rotunda]